MDYINELPDCVLSYMLSMLSIKDSLRTSVISKRWYKLVLNLRRVLNFDAYNILGNDNEMLRAGYFIEPQSDEELVDDDGNIIYESSQTMAKRLNLGLCLVEFVKRVDKYLKNFRGSKIDAFLMNFNLHHKFSNIIDQWIIFAFAKGAERIDLLFSGTRNLSVTSCYKFPFRLVFGASSSSSAVKHMRLQHFLLDLSDTITTNYDYYFIPFKNLRSFKLEDGKVDDMFITSLLSNCHRLECLSLIHCCSKSPMLNIVSSSSSSLCHLQIRYCYFIMNDQPIDLHISMDCLKLTSLEYRGTLKALSYINTPVLKSINYHLHFDEISKAFAFFAILPQLQILHISIFILGDIIPVRIIQQLKHLKELNLVIKQDSLRPGFDHLWILNNLQVFPLLQKLGVMVANPKVFDIQKDIEDLSTFSHNEIKVIEMGGCIGNQFEIEFALNVLKYAHKLEQIVMSPYWRQEDIDVPDWTYDPAWFHNGRERVCEKLRNEVAKRKAKLVLITRIIVSMLFLFVITYFSIFNL